MKSFRLHMRVIAAVLLIALLALISGCSGDTQESPSSSSAEAVVSDNIAEAAAVKTGLAFVTTLDKSKDAGEEDGFGQADSVIAAVMVGKDGKVVKCVIDMIQTKAAFDKTGRIVTPLDTKFSTKNELGADYGLSKASSIGRDWKEQTSALSAYMVGKTAEEIGGIAVDESGHVTDSDLKASVTISVPDYIDAVLKAIENAKELGASSDDKLAVGVETNIMYSSNAGIANGSVLVYATYTAITLDAGGMITSCLADGFQCNIDFDSSGKIVSDLSAVPPTKNETGDNYGLKAFSSISKEWYEQTEAFARYVTGKTPAEIESIAVNADTSPSSTDLRATVTLKIGEFKKALANASAQLG